MYRLIIRIAWASLNRRRTRSVLVVLMIAFSLWGLLFMEGIYDGMTEQMIGNAIRSGSGHLTLSVKGYRLEKDINMLIGDVAALDRFLAGDPRVQTFIKRLRQDGLIATAHYSRGASIYGVDLEAEKIHGRLDEYLEAGEYDFGRKKRGAILGVRLAEKLKVGVGRKVIISAQDAENEIASAALRVTGIIKTNNMALDETAVFVADQKARDLLRVPAGVSQVCVMVKNEEDINGLQAELRQRFPELEILRWDEIYPALMQGRVMMEGFNLVTSLLVFGVAGLGIFGIMLVSVLERLREFGIMMAIGTGFSRICYIILLESFFLGCAGCLAGGLLGGATLYYFYVHGLDLTVFSEGLDVFGMDTITYAIIRPSYFINAVFAVALATFCSVLLPLRILKKARPVEAICKG
ncbi:MAG: FtsX-like permease family protein [Thermodesulfobacteriota bacterium]|nr:FtsX-like permease family protein [Thermodesulfobacteriota bacterium]